MCYGLVYRVIEYYFEQLSNNDNINYPEEIQKRFFVRFSYTSCSRPIREEIYFPIHKGKFEVVMSIIRPEDVTIENIKLILEILERIIIQSDPEEDDVEFYIRNLALSVLADSKFKEKFNERDINYEDYYMVR